jgi:hypothetical protein
MQAPWKAGDTAAAHCPKCGDLVTAKYALRSIFLPRTVARGRRRQVAQAEPGETRGPGRLVPPAAVGGTGLTAPT